MVAALWAFGVVVACALVAIYLLLRQLDRANDRVTQEQAAHRNDVDSVRRELVRVEMEIERCRRAGTWPEPGYIVRREVDREEREARGAAFTKALTDRMEAGAVEMARALFAPRRPTGEVRDGG